MRKKLALVNLALAGAVVAAFTVITGGAVSAARPQAKVVNFASWSSNPTEAAALRKTLKVFSQESKIKVNFTVINGDYNAALKTQMTAGTAPDVFYINSDHARTFELLHQLHSLNFLKKDKSFGFNEFYKNIQYGFVYKGTTYAFAKDYSTLALFYNKAMFQKAHISHPPTTWGQFAADACKLTNKKKGIYGASLSNDIARLLPFIYEDGGAWLNKHQTKGVIDSSGAKKALTAWAGLYKKGCARMPGDLGASWNGDAFGKGLAAMTFEGNWLSSAMVQTYPSIKWGIADLPKTNGHLANINFTAGYAMWQHTPHLAAATVLMKFLAGKTGEKVWSKNVGYLPSRKDVKPVGWVHPQTYINQVKVSHGWFFPPGFIDRVNVNDDIGKAMQGKESISTALSNMEANTTAALQQAP